MVRSLQNLQSEFNDLTQQTSILAKDLYHLYGRYYQLLGDSAKKQLILAFFKVCTQAYPESFLKLPVSQRENLQRDLRLLSRDIAPQLRSSLDRARALPADQETHLETPVSEGEIVPLADLTTPEEVLLWCKQREEAITEILDKISEEANGLLQQFKVIPRQFPPKFLEIALKNEDPGSLSAQSPNILDLLLEVQGDQPEGSHFSGKERPMTKITAIHLRRSEIEFNDGQLVQTTQQTHQLLEKLSQLHQRFQRNQREKAIATAESAWRSSWHEEE